MAFNGLAATLLPNGRTLHNRFGLPVPIYSTSKSNIKHNQITQREEIKDTDVYITDEISTVPSHAMRIIDDLLQDVVGNEKPFGGKPFLTGGDFRQIPPVQKHATPAQLVNLSVKKFKHWHLFKEFKFVSLYFFYFVILD